MTGTMKRCPILKIDGWALRDISHCEHSTITKFIGAGSHFAYRCLDCDQRFDITPHIYLPPERQKGAPASQAPR